MIGCSDDMLVTVMADWAVRVERGLILRGVSLSLYMDRSSTNMDYHTLDYMFHFNASRQWRGPGFWWSDQEYCLGMGPYLKYLVSGPFPPSIGGVDQQLSFGSDASPRSAVCLSLQSFDLWVYMVLEIPRVGYGDLASYGADAADLSVSMRYIDSEYFRPGRRRNSQRPALRASVDYLVSTTYLYYAYTVGLDLVRAREGCPLAIFNVK